MRIDGVQSPSHGEINSQIPSHHCNLITDVQVLLLVPRRRRRIQMVRSFHRHCPAVSSSRQINVDIVVNTTFAVLPQELKTSLRTFAGMTGNEELKRWLDEATADKEEEEWTETEE